MPSLHERLAEAAGSRCIICSYLSTLSARERAEWEAELAKPANQISHVAVARVLIHEDVPISEASVRRHREFHAVR